MTRAIKNKESLTEGVEHEGSERGNGKRHRIAHIIINKYVDCFYI